MVLDLWIENLLIEHKAGVEERMTKIDTENLGKLSLEELIKEYPSIEELEKHIPLKKLLEKFPDPKKDPQGEHGVLLGDEIERYAKEFKLIYPFNRENLKAASYRLTVGDEYALGGKKGKLYDKEKDKITIPPFQVAIIKTREIVNLPRFLIGRWNIRVAAAYKGLLWVGGPQVDPGWVGHLFCPIYNLSSEDVELKMGDPLATIDFIRTTTFKKESEKFQFSRPPKRTSLDEYNWKLKSALLTKAGERIDEIEDTLEQFKERAEKNMESFGSRLDISITTIFTCIAFLFAALVIFVTPTGNIPSYPSKWWIYVGFFISIIALSAAIHANAKNRSNYNIAPVDVEERIKRLERFNKFVAIVMIALAIVIILIILGKI